MYNIKEHIDYKQFNDVANEVVIGAYEVCLGINGFRHRNKETQNIGSSAILTALPTWA
jgi:hypothetical protein